MPPLVSFVFPSYNRSPYVKITIEKIHALQYAFPYEIIIIDNNSDDDTVEMVRTNFPEVTMIALEENRGAVSRNLGIEKASGKYIVQLDDDSYPLPTAVEKAIDVFEGGKGDEVGCVAFNILQADGAYWTNGLTSVFTGCGAMFRKDLLEQVGGYPENYLYYAEEYDLSCRIWGSGKKVVTFEELQCFHFKAGMNRDFNHIMNRLVRNNLLLWRKYLSESSAKKQCEVELWRYDKIAHKEGVMDGYESGLKQGNEVTKPYMNGSNPLRLSKEAEMNVLGYPGIVARVDRLAEKSPDGSVILFNIGKVLHLVIKALREREINIVAIVDDNTHMQGCQFEGIEIYNREALKSLTFDNVIIGSASVSLNNDFEEELGNMNLGKPIVRMADFDQLSDYT